MLRFFLLKILYKTCNEGSCIIVIYAKVTQYASSLIRVPLPSEEDHKRVFTHAQ